MISHIVTGARGYSICEKIQTSIKTEKKQVSRNQNNRIAVRLRNRSGGDVNEGKWFLQLPPGVAFVSSSLPSLQKVGNMIILDPVIVYIKKSITFVITIKIEPTASDRLVLHSFLTDPSINCQDVASVTVSFFVYVCSSPKRPCLTLSFPCFHSIFSWSSKETRKRVDGGPQEAVGLEKS